MASAFYLSEGNRILNRFTLRWMSVEEARAQAHRHAEDAMSLPAGPFRDGHLRLIDQAATAIREAEAHAPANDGDFDPTNPPAARSAVPQLMEIAA